MFLPIAVKAQVTKADSIKVQLKMKELSRTEEMLKIKIENEDKKRDAKLKGVSPERMEEINDRQDSVCLALRSQLVETLLKMEELKISITPASPSPTPAATLRGAIRTINPSKKTNKK